MKQLGIRPGTVSAEGLAALDTRQTRIVRLLDKTLFEWAILHGAEEQVPPPLLSAAEAAQLDVFVNFPHLVSALTHITPDARHAAQDLSDAIPANDLAPAAWVLPSSVCFGVYLSLAGTRLTGNHTITSLGRCYRNEAEYDGLRRLRCFQMREVVAIGTMEHAARLTETYTSLTTALAEALGMSVQVHASGDPFFDPTGPRALMQKLDPVKKEFSYQGTALASVNVHHNFFGDRCDILLPDSSKYAFTGCVGWGYERWLYALSTHYNGDLDAACEALQGARETINPLISTQRSEYRV